MKTYIAKVLYAMAAVEMGVILIAAFVAYFVRSFDSVTGEVTDGLGRSLELTPVSHPVPWTQVCVMRRP